MADSPVREAAQRLLDALPSKDWERDGVEIIEADGTTVCFVEAEFRNRVEYSPIAEFIAAAPTLVADLLALTASDRSEIEQLRAERDALGAFVEKIAKASLRFTMDSESRMLLAAIGLEADQLMLAALRGDVSEPAPEPEATRAHGMETTIDYTNHRGERAMRRIVPHHVRFGSSEWHPEPQWMLEAFDVDKSALRSFALADVHSFAGVFPLAAPEATT